MKRLLLGLLLGALIFGVAFAGAKVATVTNPMSADLDGGGHNIGNVTNYVTGSGAVFAGQGIMVAEVDFADQLPNTTLLTSYKTGETDPSATCLDLNAGSVYSQQTGGPLGTGTLWFHPTGNPCDWRQVALTP